MAKHVREVAREKPGKNRTKKNTNKPEIVPRDEKLRHNHLNRGTVHTRSPSIVWFLQKIRQNEPTQSSCEHGIGKSQSENPRDPQKRRKRTTASNRISTDKPQTPFKSTTEQEASLKPRTGTGSIVDRTFHSRNQNSDPPNKSREETTKTGASHCTSPPPGSAPGRFSRRCCCCCCSTKKQITLGEGKMEDGDPESRSSAT